MPPEFVDAATGEIVATELLDLDALMAEHREAAEQEVAWKDRKDSRSRLLEQVMDERGMRSLTGTELRAVYYAGGMARQATGNRLREALQWGVINREQFDALVERCLRDLDPDEIARLLHEGVITDEQERYLVDRTPRLGHVRTARLLREEPRRARAQRAEWDGRLDD